MFQYFLVQHAFSNRSDIMADPGLKFLMVQQLNKNDSNSEYHESLKNNNDNVSNISSLPIDSLTDEHWISATGSVMFINVY